MFSLGALCRKNKVFFHTDAAQAVGKIPMDVNELNIDLMSISGHKIYGPKGVFQKTLCQFSCLINMAQNFYDTFILFIHSNEGLRLQTSTLKSFGENLILINSRHAWRLFLESVPWHPSCANPQIL